MSEIGPLSLCAAFSVGTHCQAYLNLQSLYSKWAAPSIKHDRISRTLLCSAIFFLWHHWEGCAAGDFSALPVILPWMCFCPLLSGVLHGSAHWKSTRCYERPCEISNVFIWLCVCMCACGWRGGERKREGGFIALFFYACDGMNLSLSPSVCARECVWVCACACVFEWM